MAHMKKRMTFHGVDYIVVPVELWEAAKEAVEGCTFEYNMEGEPQPEDKAAKELHANMLAYEGSNEPEELL